jgi:hypothetical protein
MSDSAIDAEPVADITNWRLERAITSYHVPHFFKATWIYELPIGEGKALGLRGIANTLFGGWQFTGIHQIRSGDPIAIGTGGINNPFGAARPDIVPGQPIILNSDAPRVFRGGAGGQRYLNPAAFANPPIHPGGQNVITRLGTAPPLLPNIRGPHFVTEDMAMQKLFRFAEQRSFELRATFLNPFNRSGRGGLITNITDPNFGQLTGQQMGGRVIELAARITF